MAATDPSAAASVLSLGLTISAIATYAVEVYREKEKGRVHPLGGKAEEPEGAVLLEHVGDGERALDE